MRSLSELQASFTRVIFGAAEAVFSETIVADDQLDSVARLAIYRNNIFSNYRNALADVYPVVQRLVGEHFFRQSADAYIRAHPSASGDLHDFGEAFPEFLSTYLPARELVYLPDVARLEWAVHRVSHAADTPPLPIEALARVAPERLQELRFDLSPAARLMRSDYPIVRIWEVNQPGYEGDQAVSLGDGGDRALVIRRGHMIEVERLSMGEYAMLAALSEDQTLACALEQTMAADASFDLEAFFRRHVPAGTLAALHID